MPDKVMQQYQHGLNHHRQMGYFSKWPEYERFKAGDQWPPPTENTKNLPRPVFNIIKYIENHKVSNVANENIKMVFSPEEIADGETENIELLKAQEAAEKYNKLADTTWERVKQDQLNFKMLTTANNIGPALLHYYWDASIQGGVTKKYIGEIAGENLNPINVFLGNPQEQDLDKQPWIIISYRDLVTNVKEEAKKNGAKLEEIEKITADKNTNEEGYDSAQYEMGDSEKTTVLVKYWKEKGTIWFTKVCSGVTVKKATNTEFRNIYPLVLFNWEEREKSAYGVGDTEGLIPNQKAINFLLAMMLLSAQQTAWPKIVAKLGALRQPVKNVPGEILTDHLVNSGDNIKYMQAGNFSHQTLVLVDKIVELTQKLAGATETSTGALDKAGQFNAQAIMLLQQAAGVPIEQIKKRFYQAMERVGRIWMEFWRVKYNTTRNIMVKDDDGNPMMMEFNGEEYKDIPINLKIDIGPSTAYSEQLMMASLDMLYQRGEIDVIDYLEIAPKNVVPFKDRLKKKIEQKKMETEQNATLSTLAGLMPEEREAFFSLPPEEQQGHLMQALGGNQNGMPAMQKPVKNMQVGI